MSCITDAECPNAKQGEIPEEGVVGLTKAIYPPDVCLTKGDIELDSWINDPKILDDEGDFEIEKIVDQRTSKGKNQYLVKWKVRKNGILLSNKYSFHSSLGGL